jgi:hypothetical protein
MSSVTSITGQQQQELKGLHEQFGRKVKLTGCSTAAAAFLLIGALIVIACGCLCCTLPGVNVIVDVILPAIVPAIFAILISIPCMILAVQYARDKKPLREQMILRMISHLDDYGVPEIEEQKEQVDFILKNILNWPVNPDNPRKLIKNKDWSDEYQGKILGDIKEIIGKEEKERNPRQESIAKAIDKARAKISKKQK